MPPPARLNVLIIGGGLSGLAAAVRLSQLGHTVTVLERRSARSSIGGLIMVRSNASKIIGEWGLAAEFEKVSDPASSSVYRRAEDGQVLYERIPAKYSEYPDWGTTRDSILNILFERAVANNASVRLGISVVRVWEDRDRAFLRLSTGEMLEGDIMLAADGVSSRLREKILPSHIDARPRVASMSLHQVMLTGDELRKDQHTRDLTTNSNLTVWFGHNSYAVGHFSKALDRFGAIFALPPANDESLRLWDENGDIDRVRTAFQHYEVRIRRILDLAKRCDRWRLAEMPHLKTWSSMNGRLLLLGDSAHAMLPDAAQGFSQTVEDIDTLGLLLERLTDTKHICRVWETIRIPRVERIMTFANSNHQNYQSGGQQVTQQADSNTLDNNKPPANGSPAEILPNKDAEFNSPPFNAWVYKYDTNRELEKVEVL